MRAPCGRCQTPLILESDVRRRKGHLAGSPARSRRSTSRRMLAQRSRATLDCDQQRHDARDMGTDHRLVRRRARNAAGRTRGVPRALKNEDPLSASEVVALLDAHERPAHAVLRRATSARRRWPLRPASTRFARSSRSVMRGSRTRRRRNRERTRRMCGAAAPVGEKRDHVAREHWRPPPARSQKSCGEATDVASPLKLLGRARPLTPAEP